MSLGDTQVRRLVRHAPEASGLRACVVCARARVLCVTRVCGYMHVCLSECGYVCVSECVCVCVCVCV